MHYSRRRLPHIYPPGATFFVTFSLHDALPKHVREQLWEEYKLKKIQIEKSNSSRKEKLLALDREEKRNFARFEAFLDEGTYGEAYLKQENVANCVADTLHNYDGKLYALLCYCIMATHVHVLFDTADFPEAQLPKIMQQIKGRSAYLCNKILGRKGAFWRDESYDRYVRNTQELQRIVAYILDNPIKAGLVKRREDWPFSYSVF